MSELNTEKLSLTFNKGITPTNPIIPRRYTLTHSDITSELFLNIGSNYNYNKIKSTREQIIGEWAKIDNNYCFNIYLYIDGDFGPSSTAIRNSIFRRELPITLEAIRYGDKEFFDSHPELNHAPITVYFTSTIPYFNKIEDWGTFESYDINEPHKLRLSSSFFTDNYLIDIKFSDINGDGIIDKVSLYGKKEDTSSEIYTDNITIVIQDGETNSIYTIPLKVNSGYDVSLFLGDFTGDKTDDILINIASDGSGGYGFFYVYTFTNNTPVKLFDFETFNSEYVYDVIYKDNYKVEILSKVLNKNFIIDISTKDHSYLDSIYDKDGKLKSPVSGSVSAINELYPIDMSKKEIYSLLAIQRIVGISTSDTLGFMQTPLKFNDTKFEAINSNQFVAI